MLMVLIERVVLFLRVLVWFNGDTGLQVWKAALLLADFVLHKSFTSSNFDGVTAIEVGAGTGDDSWFCMNPVDWGFSAIVPFLVYYLLKHYTSPLHDLPLTQQCFSGLVGLVLARVARKIFITGISDSFIVQFGRVVCFPFLTHWINFMFHINQTCMVVWSFWLLFGKYIWLRYPISRYKNLVGIRTSIQCGIMIPITIIITWLLSKNINII